MKLLRINIAVMLSIAILLGSCSFALAESVWPDVSDSKTVADELFKIIDLSEPALSGVASLYGGGKYSEALDAYRNYFVDKVRGIEFDKFNWHSAYISDPSIDNAKIWAGKMSVDEFKNKYPKRTILAEYYFNISGDPDQPVKPNWLGTDPNGYMPDQMWLRWFTNFNAAYWKTGDEVYIKKYFQLINDLALNFKKQALNGGLSQTDYRSWAKNNNFVFCAMTRTDFILRQFVCFAKLLPDDGEKPKWDNVMDARNYKVKPEAYNLISSEALANTIINIFNDVNPFFLNAYIKPGATPNQRLGGLQDLLIESLLFSEAKPVKDTITPALNEVYDSYLRGYIHPDGGNIEQAFNYNVGDLARLKTDVKYCESMKVRPAYYELLKLRTEYNNRLFEVLNRPIGGAPAVGMGSINQSEPTWKKEVQDKYIKNGTANTYDFKNFDSIALPYSGYYAFRSGWGVNDTYLFTQGPRRSSGHLYPSNGSIELQAFGRQLLMAGGAPYYFESQVPRELLPEWGMFNSYFAEGSSFDRNTVLVNGMSQDKTESDGSILNDLSGSEPIPALWHTGNSFDMTQTFWKGGYSQDGGKNKTLNGVEHQRDIVYLKGCNAFILTDFMRSQKEGVKYSQVWNFPPHMSKNEGDDLSVFGYKNEQVVADKDKRTISTGDPDGPNVFLHNFINQPVEYVKYFGYKSDSGYKGWYSPGIEGKRYPKPDVYVNWNKTVDDSPMLTLISVSQNTTDPITDIKDISDKAKGQSVFSAKCGESQITCYVGYQPNVINYKKINTKANWLLVTENKDSLSGIALGCEAFAFGDKKVELKCENFEFNITAGEIKITPITAPTGFAWVEKDGEPMPVYSRASAKDAVKAAESLNQATVGIYPVKAEIRSYMEKRVDTVVSKTKQGIYIMANCGDVVDAAKISDSIIALSDMLIKYGLASSAVYMREHICGITADIIREIIKSKANCSDVKITESMQKLAEVIAKKAEMLYKDTSSAEKLKQMIEDALQGK